MWTDVVSYRTVVHPHILIFHEIRIDESLYGSGFICSYPYFNNFTLTCILQNTFPQQSTTKHLQFESFTKRSSIFHVIETYQASLPFAFSYKNKIMYIIYSLTKLMWHTYNMKVLLEWAIFHFLIYNSWKWRISANSKHLHNMWMTVPAAHSIPL